MLQNHSTWKTPANTGVFLGASGGHEGLIASLKLVNEDKPSVFASTSSSLAVASGRVSFILGLVGPCCTLDTACSSALTALHLSTLCFRLGECENACVVGVKVLKYHVTIGFATAGMLSPRG